jgi:transposase
MYTDLEDLLKRSPKPLEVKRGLAVKQDLAGKSRKLIAEILSVTEAFISKWRIIYEEYGVNGLQSAYQGAKPRAYLSEEKKAEVLAHISSHQVFGFSELVAYLQINHGVSFKSSQSYYDLLHAARMSWHKSQKVNPRRDAQKVATKRDEIKKNFKKSENLSKNGRQ